MSVACDACGGTSYYGDPYVEVRVTRPSDPMELCCILAGHDSCFPGSKTPAEWEAWMESGEGAAAGFAWLT